MVKTLATLLILSSASVLYAQNQPGIQLNGKVSYWDKRPVLYYTLNEEAFSSKHSVKLDKDMNYTLDLSTTAYKNAANGKLVFSADTMSKPTNDNGCIVSLDLEELYRYTIGSGKKQAVIHADLPLSFGCTIVAWYGAEGAEERFEGKYQLKVNDTTFYVNLDRDLYRYTSSFTPSTADHTNEEWGSWKYQNGYLYLETEFRRNRLSGIMIVSGVVRKFKVITNPQNSLFQLEPAGNYTIQKL